MPKMQVTIDDRKFEVKRHTSKEIDVPDGMHHIQVDCGGGSSSQKVNTSGKHRMIITSVIPNWYYVLYILLVAVSLFFYLSGKVSMLLFGIILISVLIVHLCITLVNRNKYFRVIIS